MTVRFSRVFENPEKTFSTSLFVFSLIRRASFVKKPVWTPTEHRKPPGIGRDQRRVEAENGEDNEGLDGVLPEKAIRKAI
ncbi:uncharacterized protein A4U43_UnF8360 [Asparagus officinalis]|uniref:Uncharacterized protein n=1 Tax=Asparagus officinalis TaxID=4686 RepID=A0A1R3L5Z0_ASPOF|nr:uncharacterized protein A4U43_UnF8360 [Asparagus officinalis]